MIDIVVLLCYSKILLVLIMLLMVLDIYIFLIKIIVVNVVLLLKVAECLKMIGWLME